MKRLRNPGPPRVMPRIACHGRRLAPTVALHPGYETQCGRSDLLNRSTDPTRRANHFGLSELLSSPSDKNISVFQNSKTVYIKRHPVPLKGHCARSPMRDGDAVDADGAPDQDA
jgi:hypothetical protein